MPTYTLAQLRTLQMQATISGRLTAALSAAGLPVADWAPAATGGLELSVVEMAAGTLASIVSPKLVAIAEGRILSFATGDWLTAYAKSRYKIERGLATYTIQNMRLVSTVGDNFAPRDLWVAGAGGHRYVSLEAVNLKPNEPQNVHFQAEEPGSAYNDVAGNITKMVTAPAGLTAVNVRPQEFADTHLLGTSTGTIKATFIPLPAPVGVVAVLLGARAPSRPAFDSVRVRIDVFGDIGSGICSISTDGGATWPDSMPIPVTRDLGNSSTGGAILTFANGTTPSFIQGDIFTMVVGDAILQRGADRESDPSLRERCRSRWSTLSDVPTEGAVRLWCFEASPEIARVRVDADANSPGGILVTIASATGPASPQAQIAVQDAIASRLLGFQGILGPSDTTVGGSPAERAQCNSAKGRQITQSGQVTVPHKKVAAIQQEADRLWQAYLGSVDIGGVVRMAELVQALTDAGAIDATDLLLGLPMLPHANISLADDEVPVPATGVTLTNSMRWLPV